MRRRRSGEKYRSPGEDDFSSEDAGPPTAFRMTIFPDGNRRRKTFYLPLKNTEIYTRIETKRETNQAR